MTLQQIGRDALRVPRVGCLSKAARSMASEPENPHCPRHALLAGSRPSAPESAPNTRRAVSTTVLVKDLFDLGSEHSIVRGARARLGVQPLVVAAARDLKYATSSSRRDVRPLRVNELVHGYFTSFAKRAAAFFNSEFSAWRSRNSRRSRSISSRSPWLDGGLPVSSGSKRSRQRWSM